MNTIILDKVTLQDRNDILKLRQGGSGETFDICTLDEISFINDTDMIVLCRDGVNKKISALNLKNYILGVIPENVVQYNNEIITFNGGAVLYTEALYPLQHCL